MKDRRSGRLEPGAVDAFRAKLRQATELIIAVRRKLGEEGDELRADVLADIKDALALDEPSVEEIRVEGEPEPQWSITTEGIYRAVLAEFGLDRSDPYVQETMFEWVRRDLDEALAGDAAGRTD